MFPSKIYKRQKLNHMLDCSTTYPRADDSHRIHLHLIFHKALWGVGIHFCYFTGRSRTVSLSSCSLAEERHSERPAHFQLRQMKSANVRKWFTDWFQVIKENGIKSATFERLFVAFAGIKRPWNENRMACHTIKTENRLLWFLFQWREADWLQRGASRLRGVWQQQSDEWQLTGLSVLTLCRRAAASGQQAKWAKCQNDPNIQANSPLRERPISMCCII